eukprot:4660493-Amphidinium_carterae.1
MHTIATLSAACCAKHRRKPCESHELLRGLHTGHLEMQSFPYLELDTQTSLGENEVLWSLFSSRKL